MKTYLINGISVAIVNGELFVQATPIELAVASEVFNEQAPEKPRRGRKSGYGFKQARDKMKEYGRTPRKRLGPEAEEVIRAEIAAGAKMVDICKKYSISVSKFYQLKNEDRSKPVHEE